jgi:Putative beta-barrel porin-2, OmpL-like. bbp2
VVREQQQQDQEKGALSGMSEFWQAIDVNMSVAGSYNYNFKNPTDFTGSGHPGDSLNQGRDGAFYPFHGDHNSFQVDQVWIDIGKAVTNESRAGFMFSILYGNTAAFDAQGFNYGERRNLADDSTSDYYVEQAYVKYLAPLGEGVEFDLGKFNTLLGAEVADASKNWNITRGNEWTLLQSIDHVGLLASTTAGPMVFAAGVVNQNNVLTSSPDINSEKSYLGKIAFAPKDGPFSVAANVLYGAEGSESTIAGFGGLTCGTPHAGTGSCSTTNGRRTGLFDLLANYNSDAFSAWVDADYSWLEGTGSAAWALAVAGKVPLTDVFSAALRLEYLRDQNNWFGLLGPRHSEIYGATGTLAYELAENLTLKGEVRWDKVNESAAGFHEFANNSSSGHGTEDQVVGVAQVVYAF